jgi:hypothetical protein
MALPGAITLLAAIMLFAFAPAAQCASPAALKITTKTLPTGYLGSNYSATLSATGGSGKGYTWSIPPGTLPAGLGLVKDKITGEPTAMATTQFTVEVKDSASHTATANLSIAVDAGLAVSTSALANGYVGSAYSASLAATGGSGTGYKWSVSSGTLPKGLKLSAGAISGKPTAVGAKSFTIEVKDSASNKATAKLTLTVGPELEITSALTLPVGYVGTTYSDTLTATGGSGAGYTWSYTPPLPQDITLSSGGVFSGLPATPSTSTIDVEVTDSAANKATAKLKLKINPPSTACINDAHPMALVELRGLYTFTLDRFNLTTGSRYTTVGSFSADGLGNIRNGVMDSNGPKFPAEIQNTFTGTYSIGTDGRGAINAVIAGASAVTDTFCIALDTIGTDGRAYHAAVIEDDATNTVSSGEFFAQTVPPTLLSVKGTWVVGLTGRHEPPRATLTVPFRHTVAGYMTFDGAGNVTGGELDQNKDHINASNVLANIYTPEIEISGTYTMPASKNPTSRGTIQIEDASTSTVLGNFVFYPAGQNYIVVLEIDKAAPVGGEYEVVLSGLGYRRTGTSFSTATGLLGSSVRTQSFLVNTNTTNESNGVGIDVAVWDGAGNFTYSGDMNAGGVATSTSGSGTYTVDANGRFAIMENGVCSPCGYLIQTNEGVAIYDSTDGGIGLMESQDVPLGGDFQLSGFLGAFNVGTRWFSFPEQQTVAGELVSDGAGNIPGTLDMNQQGDVEVNQGVVETETATSTSGTSGRFLLSNSDGSSSAFYLVNVLEALSIQLSASDGVTQPINQYYF